MTMLAVSPAVALPRMGVLLRHALPRVLESMVMPVAVFYLGLLVAGLAGAFAIAAAWVYGGLVWRLARRQTVPGGVLLASIMMTVRLALVLVFVDPRLFFLQPTLGVFCASAAFLVTAKARRPLAERVAADLVPLPERVVAHPRMRRFYTRQSLMWGLAQLGNGALSMWLLLTLPVETYVLVRALAVAVLLGGAALATVLDFRRSLRSLA